MVKKMQYKIVIAITIAFVIMLSILGAKWYITNQSYANLISNGDKAISEEKYDDALRLYKEALRYKNDSSINIKVQLATTLKKSKETYDTAIRQMTDKNYLEAINSFKKVDKQDSNRYQSTQIKINECTKLYIADNLKSANNNLAANKFSEANKYIENILKLDANNIDAKKLKDNITTAIQKQEYESAAIAASTQAPANGPISFSQALSIVLKDAFPDNNYIKIKNEYNGYIYYYSPDSSGVNGNPVAKNQSETHGKAITYDSMEAIPIEATFNGDNNKINTKICYMINSPVDGKIHDGYYVEAQTGKVYKYNMGHIKSLN